MDHEILRESTFFIGGGGGTGLRRGGSLVNFLQIGEAQTCFIRNGGGVTVFLGKEKIYPCRFSFLPFEGDLLMGKVQG